jgi:kinesin family protein 4/21/27
MGENGETVNLQYEERSLRVRWNGKKEFFIENLFNFECTDVKQAMNWFLTGVKNKHMASHRLNHSSSRSHCTFEITIEQQKAVEEDEEAQTIISKLTLVDLAGSEKLQHYRHSDLMKESININRSLLTLGKCISALTSGKDHHVPYRESQLTKLLKHSLGGNCFTMIVACVSPSDSFVDENVNTLYYASRARKIKNDPVVNEDAQQKLIRKLKLEIRDLRAENASLQQLVDIGPERVVLKENDSVARPDANSRDTSFLQEKVVASVSMLQKLSTMNKTLRESFDDLEQSHQKLQGQNKDLELENQSLRERIEILESLLDGPPVYQQRQYEHAVNDRTPEPLLRATAPVPKKKQLPRLRPSTSHSTPTKMRSPSNRQKSTPTPDRNSYAERRQSRTPFQSDKPERPPPRGYDLSRFNTDSSTDRDEIANMFMSMYRTN